MQNYRVSKNMVCGNSCRVILLYFNKMSQPMVLDLYNLYICFSTQNSKLNAKKVFEIGCAVLKL